MIHDSTALKPANGHASSAWTNARAVATPCPTVTRLAVIGLAVSLFGFGCQRSGPQPPGYNPEQVTALRDALSRNIEQESAAESQESASTLSPTGWTSLRGRVQFSGEAPANPRIEITADKEMCAPGNKPVFAHEVVVGPEGGLQNVVVYLTSAIPDEEPWTHPSAQASQPGDVEFDQKQCVFLTHVAAMRVGQTLLIMNSDVGGHNTQIFSPKNPFNQTIPAGATVKFTPKKAETSGPIVVKCAMHPWMLGYLLIHNNGYFAVTDETGKFEIPNLPAGVPLEFRIWQEKSGHLEGIDVAGQSVKKGRFTLTLDPQDPAANELDIQLDASALN